VCDSLKGCSKFSNNNTNITISSSYNYMKSELTFLAYGMPQLYMDSDFGNQNLTDIINKTELFPW